MADEEISLEIMAILEQQAAISARLRAETARPSVLVVDDDAAQLRAIERVLRSHYHTQTARSASDAIRILEGGLRFDIILCDMWMPGIDGSIFHGAVARIAPEEAARTIFVTGGGLTPQLESFLSDKRVLRKPWRRDDLLSAVEETLEAIGG